MLQHSVTSAWLTRRLRRAACGLMLAGLVVPGATAAIDLGSRRELFVDRYLIEEVRGVELRLHAPVKAPRPMSPMKGIYMTVIRDGDRYRAWSRGDDPAYDGPRPSGHPGETVLYAESRDGHEWTFPSLQLHEVGGTRDNNVLLAKLPPYLHNFMPFLDTREGVPAAERYKAVAGYPGSGNKLGLKKSGIGLFSFVSPDGMSWTKRNEIIAYRPEWRHAFDSANVAFWSEAEQLYVCYFRTWMEPGRLRSISRATSPDFVHWSEPVAMNPNRPGEHLYTSGTHPYVRAPHIYIALPTRFVPQAGDSADSVRPNVTDVLFMTTRAGTTHYDRIFGEAFIRPGRDPARWINRANYVAQNVVQTAPDELSIYHRGGDRYVLRVDGFASAHADDAPGTLLSKAFTFAGAQLELNFATSAAGLVGVELLEEGGRVLASSPDLIGDEIARVVPWKGRADVREFAGRPVRLRLTLRDADLYSFRFFNEPERNQ